MPILTFVGSTVTCHKPVVFLGRTEAGSCCQIAQPVRILSISIFPLALSLFLSPFRSFPSPTFHTKFPFASCPAHPCP